MTLSAGIFGQAPKFAHPLGAESGDWVWKNTTPNPAVKTFQTQLNVTLKKFGYYPIDTDGKLGPGTCGAWLHMMNTQSAAALEAANFPFDPPTGNWGSVCQSWTYPTKVGKAKPEINPVARGDAALPWKSYAKETESAQAQINRELVEHGYLAMTIDGKMGAGTCGAMKTLEDIAGAPFLQNYGKNCQSFTAPTKAASSGPVIVPSTPVGPAPTPTPVGPTPGPVGPVIVAPTKPKMSTASMATGIAAVALLGLGAWYAKKKGMF